MSEVEEQKEVQPVETPVAKIVSPKERDRYVDLEYPVEFDGKLYEQIHIRKVTGQQIADFAAAMQKAAQDATAFPLPPVIDCPAEVWAAMDADDQANVDEAAQAFMPRRLKAVAEQLGLMIGDLTSDS